MASSNGAVLVQEPAALAPSFVGRGIIPKGWGRKRAELVGQLNAAYGRVLDGSGDNYLMWQHVRTLVRRTLRETWAAAGLEAAPYHYDALLARVDLPTPSADPEGHVRLVEAMLTDYSARSDEHIAYRLATDGNVHLEFAGPTGTAKSSCAMSVADAIDRIPRGHLVKHLSFDLSELPGKIEGKKPRQTVVQDEYPQSSGEGAATTEKALSNIEDTLRASQVNLFVCSPRRHEYATMQATYEIILWNRKDMWSLALVWIEDKPHGVIGIPWCAADLWAEYGPWKQGNVRRSMAGQFRDNGYLVRSAMALCNNEKFVSFIESATNKPKKADFMAAVEFFHPQMMAGSQVGKMVDFMLNMANNWKRLEPEFEAWFGIKPSPGFLKIAKKCYEE